MANQLQSVYLSGGTTISNYYNPNNLSFARRNNLPDQVINVIVDNNIDELDRYAIDNWSDGVNHRTGLATLFGMKDFTLRYLDGREATGDPMYTAVGVSVAGPVGGWSFIFCDRIQNAQTIDEYRRKEFDRVVIHELGHQRGNGLDHANHKGKNSWICTMYSPESNWTNERIRRFLDVRRFCEGHQQVLYNISWSPSN